MLAAHAAQLLEPLDDQPPRSRVEQVDPARLGRLIGWIGAGTAAALVGTVVAITLILIQFSTRTEVAEQAADRAVAEVAAQQQELAAAHCALLDLGRLHPADPQPVTELERLHASRHEAAYQARGCP